MKAFKNERRGVAFSGGVPIRPSTEREVGNKRITRTSAGLRDALFDAIEKLGAGELDGTQAQAMATLAKQKMRRDTVAMREKRQAEYRRSRERKPNAWYRKQRALRRVALSTTQEDTR